MKINVNHYQLSKSNQINDIIDDIKEKYGIRNLMPQGSPLPLNGNHKILTLKYLNRDTIIRISGPGFIIDDIYLIWFTNICI